MKVGILSDTHGACAITKIVAEQMLKAQIDAVFHCGDFGGAKTLTLLSSIFYPLNIPVYIVLGNVDPPYRSAPEGITLLDRFGTITCAGKQIALLHGDDRKRLQTAIFSKEFDLVFSGHTHTPHDYTIGKTRCINPGSVSWGRGSPESFAILDLDSKKLSIQSC
jgi:putative phosphoesterase